MTGLVSWRQAEIRDFITGSSSTMIALVLAALGSFPIVEQGTACAAVAPLPADAPAEVRRGVAELQRVIEKMSGTRLPSEGPPEMPQIHVGRDAFVEQAGLKLDALDEDGFVIQTLGSRDLVLAGRSPHGTEFAVYRFLQKYAGARWYLPTELGEVVPRRDSFAVEALADREQPSFHSRQWSSAAPFDGGQWERHNLCRGRYNFHHNLLHVFVPSQLYDRHPDWFPEIQGKRFRPADDQAHNWQPCLSNPEAAAFAAACARKYFSQHPQASSFSLGMNDTAAAGFCQCASCQALDPVDVQEQKTPRGMPNYSNRFFTFANRVAAELAKTHPDKYLGCLAYHVTEPPPTFDVHPRIIPYLTAGRANWTDPAIRTGDQTLIRGWCRKAPVVGIYDYYYGSGFVSPRIFTGLTEESLKFAHQTGVRGFYAEIYSTWSLDGPKAWVASQLLWDVQQSAEALVDEFCRDLFGQAAGPMREYFRYCEQRWMSRPSGSTTMWAGFFDPRQLDLWPAAACAKARELLTAAEQAAGPGRTPVLERVRLFSDGFRQTELWSALYHGETQVQSAQDVLRFLRTLEARESLQRDVINKNPLHRAPILFEERAKWVPGSSLAGRLLTIADEPGADRVLQEIAGRYPQLAGEVRAAVTMREQGEKVPQKLINPGFEPASGSAVDEKSLPPGWSVWFRPGTPGETRWTTAAARSGSHGVLVRGAEAGGFLQSVSVQPGKSYVASIYVRGRLSPQAHGEFVVQWQDAQGKWLPSETRRETRLPASGNSDWQRLAVYAPVPPAAARLIFGVFLYQQPVGEALELDDASLRQVP
jgi:hypothetical protein